MIDNPQSVPREKVGAVVGHLDDAAMLAVNRALAAFLGFARPAAGLAWTVLPVIGREDVIGWL